MKHTPALYFGVFSAHYVGLKCCLSPETCTEPFWCFTAVVSVGRMLNAVHFLIPKGKKKMEDRNQLKCSGTGVGKPSFFHIS